MKIYIYIQIICIIFSIILKTNIYANQSHPNLQNSISEKIENKTLFVLNSEAGYNPKWFISSKSDLVQLKNPPATMLHIYKLKASDNKKFLAVLSAGEGHPEVGIFNLAEILDDKNSEIIYGIDPYPGIVDLVEWKGKYLHITSDIFLTEKVGKYGRVPDALSLFSPESFLLDTNTGKVEPVSEKLKNSVTYYGLHLLETPDENSPLTELWAFSELNDVNSIPYLKKALKMERYSKYKKDINELLLKLKKR